LEGKNTFLAGHDFYFYHIFKTNLSGSKKIWVGPVAQEWANSGPNVARHSVFSGPQKHSGKSSTLKFLPTSHSTY